MSKPFTAKQRHWLNHIQAVQQSGGRYADYAASHDLDVKALYNWTAMLRRKGLLKTKSAFVELSTGVDQPNVANGSSASAAVARLPNGIVLELPTLDGALLRWLASL